MTSLSYSYEDNNRFDMFFKDILSQLECMAAFTLHLYYNSKHQAYKLLASNKNTLKLKIKAAFAQVSVSIVRITQIATLPSKKGLNSSVKTLAELFYK